MANSYVNIVIRRHGSYTVIGTSITHLHATSVSYLPPDYVTKTFGVSWKTSLCAIPTLGQMKCYPK